MKDSNYNCDVLIIGSGIAGLSLALRLSPTYRIIILSKNLIHEGSTFYAQGGIAVVLDNHDSIESHINDTIKAGAGLCEYKTVLFTIENAKHCVEWLINKGATFDKKNDNIIESNYHLALEGGHSHRRILHNTDNTGHMIITTLINQIFLHKNIKILEYVSAIDIITSDSISLSGPKRALGAWIFNKKQNCIEICSAKIVVLATGGAAKVYQYTTNPNVVSGDGIAMAWRAGCRVANLEFNQFHPTCLFISKPSNFLLSEALRGEGALLKRPDGSCFMKEFDIRGELAPRDIVARAIFNEIERLHVKCIYLDISHRPAKFIIRHFPNIYKKLLTYGFDLTKQLIPIIPAAHYTCGGVVVNKYGQTDISGLYAIGEVSYTGLHGANRLASNSLLECLVYSWSASRAISLSLPNLSYHRYLPFWNKIHFCDYDEQLKIRCEWQKLRFTMWNNVGIIRSDASLKTALNHIKLLQNKFVSYYEKLHLLDESLEFRNMLQLAELIIRSAILRKESRGLHYTLDYPYASSYSIPTMLIPTNYTKYY